MATLQATRILEALQKAKKVGRVEDPVTIDGCPLVLSNLTPEDYEDINGELEGLEDVEYLNTFQTSHICRSIVELGDTDLRDVDFVEDEVPSGKVLLSAAVSKKLGEELLKKVREAGGEGSIAPDGEVKLVRLERHDWIRSRVLSDWGREALLVAWRKFAEVVELAEERSKAGIQFRIPDESSEERFRRLLKELKEVEDDLPFEIVRSVLDESGYISKSSAEELEAVEKRMRRMASEREAQEEPPVAPQPAPQRPQPPQQVSEQPAPQPAPQASTLTPQEMMRRRQPLNRQPAPPPAPAPRQAPPQRAGEKVPVPEQLRRAAQSNSSVLGRSAQIAALEGAVDPDVVAELSQKAEGIDGSAVASITDQPPMAGINTRFRPPPGTGR